MSRPGGPEGTPIPMEAAIQTPTTVSEVRRDRRGPVPLEPSTSRLAKRSRVLSLWDTGAVIPGFRVRSRRGLTPHIPLTRSRLRRAEVIANEIGFAYQVRRRVDEPAKEDFIELMDDMNAVGVQSDPDHGNYNATVEKQTLVDEKGTDTKVVYESLSPEKRRGRIVKEAVLTLTSGDELRTASGEVVPLEFLLESAKEAARASGVTQEALDTLTVGMAYRITDAQRLKVLGRSEPVRGLVLQRKVGVRFAAVDDDREINIRRPKTVRRRLMTPREKSKQKRFKESLRAQKAQATSSSVPAVL